MITTIEFYYRTLKLLFHWGPDARTDPRDSGRIEGIVSWVLRQGNNAICPGWWSNRCLPQNMWSERRYEDQPAADVL